MERDRHEVTSQKILKKRTDKQKRIREKKGKKGGRKDRMKEIEREREMKNKNEERREIRSRW